MLKIKKFQYGGGSPSSLLGAGASFSGIDYMGAFRKKQFDAEGKEIALTDGQKTQGAKINAAVGAGLGAAFNIGTGLSNVNNSNMTSMQKNGAKADLVANGLADGAIASGNPYAMAAGALIKGVDMIGGALMKNNKASKMAKSFQVNDLVGTSSSYAGIADSANSTKGNGDTYVKSGLFGKLGMGSGALKNQITNSNIKQKAASGLLADNKLRMQGAASSQDLMNSKFTNQVYNTDMWNKGSIQFGKTGTKLEDIRKIVEKVKTVKTPEIPTFKDGGAINVIVDGKLHAHKHSLKDIEDFEDANITEKGIPVITVEKDGGVIQHAEVEKDELILHLELSKKLEELMEDGSDEAAIEAGKLLANELVKNTKDSKSKILKTA